MLRRLHVRPVTIVLLVLLVVLQYELWFQPTGIVSLLHLHSQIHQQETDNTALAVRNNLVLMQVTALKKGNDMMETRARNELGMVKKGEVYYQIIDDSKN